MEFVFPDGTCVSLPKLTWVLMDTDSVFFSYAEFSKYIDQVPKEMIEELREKLIQNAIPFCVVDSLKIKK